MPIKRTRKIIRRKDSVQSKNLRQEDSNKHIPNVRIIGIGGFEEVGRNMTIIEYRPEEDPSKNDIIIIDMGLQFAPDSMPGVDYIIPNISYLKGKEQNIRGMIITHAHIDHVGAIPHLYKQIGSPTIYTREFSSAFIKGRQEDFPNSGKLNIKEVKPKDTIKLGKLEIEFFHVNHTIPHSMGLLIKTPEGNILHTGDFEIDLNPYDEKPFDFHHLAEIGKEGVDMAMIDTTNADVPGHSIPETNVFRNMLHLINDLEGRVIIGTFSSLITRIQQLVKIGEKLGRVVAIEGYSMKKNTEICKKLGLLDVRKNTLIPIEKVDDYPDNKVMIVCTGAQGEHNAALMKFATNSHRSFRLKKGDTIMFSSSIIPGNDSNINKLKDLLIRQGVIIKDYKMLDIHSGGHARQNDILLLLNLIQPKNFMPIEQEYLYKIQGAQLAAQFGIPKDNIFLPGNGQVVEMTKGQFKVIKTKVPTDYVLVDGLGHGDIGNVVIKDRQQLAKEGMITIIVPINRQTSDLARKPEILSRGFIYMKSSVKLIDEVRELVKHIVRENNSSPRSINWFYVQGQLKQEVSDFLYRKTRRNPMVLPIVFEV